MAFYRPSWSLNEIKGLPFRERRYWMEEGSWRMTPRG